MNTFVSRLHLYDCDVCRTVGLKDCSITENIEIRSRIFVSLTYCSLNPVVGQHRLTLSS